MRIQWWQDNYLGLNGKDLHNKFLRNNLTDVFNGKTTSKIPAVSFTQTATIELMKKSGSYWPESHSDPEKMALLAIEGNRTVGFEAVRIPYCLTVLSEATGCEVNMGTADRQPSVISHPAESTIEGIKVPHDLLERGRIPVVLESTAFLKEKVGEELPIIVGIEGPAVVASNLTGVRNYLVWSITSPDKLTELIRIATDACIEYANSLFNQGADIVVLADGVASPDLLPPSAFENIMVPEYRRFCRNVKGIKVMHMCGNANPILHPLAECGFNGISVEEKVKNLAGARAILGSGVKLIGNISAAGTLLLGSPDDVRSEVIRCLEEGIDVLAPGCGVAPHTSTENLRAIIWARDEYYLHMTR